MNRIVQLLPSELLVHRMQTPTLLLQQEVRLYRAPDMEANEAVLNMLDEIGSFDNVNQFIDSVKNGEGRLMGLGHRATKTTTLGHKSSKKPLTKF